MPMHEIFSVTRADGRSSQYTSLVMALHVLRKDYPLGTFAKSEWGWLFWPGDMPADKDAATAVAAICKIY